MLFHDFTLPVSEVKKKATQCMARMDSGCRIKYQNKLLILTKDVKM